MDLNQWAAPAADLPPHSQVVRKYLTTECAHPQLSQYGNTIPRRPYPMTRHPHPYME
jgi:hypothetical protein